MSFSYLAGSGHYILMTGGSISSKTFTMLSNTMFTTYGIVSVDIVGSEGNQIVTLEHEDASVAGVNLGAGNDQFLFHKGTLTANVDLGAGDDIVELAAGALDAGITIDGGENANDFDTLNYNLTSGSTLSSTSLDQLHNFERFNIQLMPGSSVASDFHLSANDDSLVWWGGATFTSVVTVDAQGGTDTLTLVPGSAANTVNITAIFSGFQVFEVVAKESREGTMFSGGNVDQSVDINLGTTGRATFSTGAYVIKDGFELTTHTLRVDGGSLKREASGTGKVMLSGEDVEVIFSAGSLDVLIDGSMASGDVTLTLSPAMDVTIALDMDTLSDFTKLTQDGVGTVQQQGSLNLGASGEVTLSAGSYSIAANQLLTTNKLEVGSSVTLSALATSSASDVAGAIILTGSNAELIYRGGTITTVIDATGATGGATFRINIADGDEATSPTGTLFSGFTKFIKEGLGTFTQKTNWGTGNTNEITIKEGTYILEEDLTLASVTFSGDMTKLEVTGTITGGITVIGSDSTSQTVRVFDGASLAAITLGEGDDTIEYTGGMLTENIYLGDGSDTFFSQGSTLNLATGKTIDGGEGLDTLLFDITGTITTDLFNRFVSFERFHFRLLGSNTLNVDLTLSANNDIFEWDGLGELGTLDFPVTVDAGAGSGDILHYTIRGLVETSPFTTATETPEGLAYYFTGFEEYHLTLTSTGEIRTTLTLGASDDTFTWEITNGYTSLAGVFNAVAANGIATLDGKVDAGAGHDTLIIKGKGHTYIDRDRTFRSAFVNFEEWIVGGESVSNPEGCYFSGTVSGRPAINFTTGTISSFNSFADDCTVLMLGFRSTLAGHAKTEGESVQTIREDSEVKIGQAPSEDSAGDSSLTVRHGATLILYSATDSANDLAFSEQTLLSVKDFKLEGQLFTYYGAGNNFLSGSYLSLYDEGTFTWAPVSQPKFATLGHHTAIIVAGASNKIVGKGETALFDPPDGVTLNITTTRADLIDSQNQGSGAINIEMGFSLYGFENFIKRGPGILRLQIPRGGLNHSQLFALRELIVEEGTVSISGQSGLIAPKIIFKDGVNISGGLIGLARQLEFYIRTGSLAEKTPLVGEPSFDRVDERQYVYQYLKTLFDPTREDSNFDKILFEIGGASLSNVRFQIGKLDVIVDYADDSFEYQIVKDPSLDALIRVNPGAGFTTSFTNISFDGFSEMEVSGAGDVVHAGGSTVRDKVTFVAAEAGETRGSYFFRNGGLVTNDLTLAGGDLYVEEGHGGWIALHGVSSTFDWRAGDFIGINLAADNRAPTDPEDEATFDIDTFSITRSGSFGIDGSIIAGFEIFILNNVGATLTQSGDFVVLGTTTLTAGTYIVAAGGTLNSQSLTLASDASLQIAPAIEDDPNTLEIVETTPAGKVELSGASTFTWAGGTLGGDNQLVIMIVADDLADEIDTFNLQHGTGEDISIIGSHFTGFEVFTKSGAAAIEQIGTFSVANKVTLSAGTYTIADEGILQTTDLTVSGSGSLKVAATNTDATKAGKVTLLGDSTFSWQSGVVNTVVDATNGGGVDHIDLVLTGSMAINAALFKGFDTLTVSGTGQGSQTGALNLTGLLTFSAGSYTYTLAAGAGLTGSDLTVVGGSLAALGTVAGEDIGKVTLLGDSTLLWQGGAISALIDATNGTGNDTLNLQPIANFDIDAALITGFEVFTLDGTASGTTTISQSNTLAIGNASSVGSMATFSRANTTYTIADEGVLEVYGSLTVTDGALAATGTGKVLLHGTSTLTWSGGSITAPVTADNNANEIDKFVLIYDGTLSTFDGSLFTGFEAFTNTDASTVSVTGAITQQGALTIGGTVTFAELAASTSFTYTIAAEGVLSAVNLSLAGGSLNAGAAAGKASGKIDLTGASTFTWTGGTIGAGLVITADDKAGEMDSMDLTNTAALSIAGESFVGFESFTKDGAGTVTQSGTFTIGGLATFSAGSYTIADGAMLQAVNLTIDGGGLAVESGMGKTGSGKVVLTGASTFKLSATGSYDVGLAIEADNVAMGVEVDSFVIEHNGGTLSLNGDIITGFEKFTASGSSDITQSGTLAIAGDVTFSAGSYTIADGAMLQAVNLTIDGGGLAVESGTGKAGSGKVVLTGASTFTWSDGSYNVGLAITADNVAMGVEIDKFEISHSGGTLDLDGAKITGFEEFTVSGNSAITQTGTLVIAGDVTFSAGEYMSRYSNNFSRRVYSRW